MTSDESTAFKAEVKPYLELAIESNGGIDRVRRVYRMMNSLIDFLAGWVAGEVRHRRNSELLMAATLGRANGSPNLSHEETRRIYDLVRLRLDSESSTS